MKERGWIEPIVERVVGQVLDRNAAQLRIEIVGRVMEEIRAEPSIPDSVPPSRPADLARAVAEIQLGTSQREILRALLDTSACCASRVALFVVKGSHASGWQARGFDNNDALKDFALDGNAPAISRALDVRLAASAPEADLDSRFLQEFGSPSSAEGWVFPLILKDKVAALLYADRGTDTAGLLDAGALEVLVLSTTAWLEVNSLRKQTQKDSSAVPAEHLGSHADSQGVSTYPAPADHDPFAAHAPSYALAAAAAAGEVSVPVANPAVEASAPVVEAQIASAEGQSAVVELEAALAEPAASGPAEATATPEVPPISSLSPEHQDIHRKAQRFARLLVDEIKLYNQAKVAEGRKNRDLYDRLQEAIEKSRATYQKRYGNTPAASANYFQHEIIRSLAEDDLSIMGANFRQ